MAKKPDWGKQIGPMPMGAWVAVVAGGLGIAWWTRRSNSSGSVAPGVDTSLDPGVGTGINAVSVVPFGGPADPNAGGNTSITDNTSWGRVAIERLTAMGINSGGIVSSAITKGLQGGFDESGNPMSITEWSLWSMAITILGPPPTPVQVSPPSQAPGPVIPTVPPPVVTQPQPAPQQKGNFRYFTVTKWPAPGSTLWSIAQMEYGNPFKYVNIFWANAHGGIRADGWPGPISNPNQLQPGWVLLIP